MPITPEENEKYRKFVSERLYELGCFDFEDVNTAWHYTDGSGLLGVIESGTIFATQVACVSDTTETTYAMDLFRDHVG